MMSAAPKRSRASAEQLSQMTDFMLQWPGLSTGKFQKMHGKYEHEKKWEELAALLNSTGGAVKSVEQWRNVWRDLKSRSSNKIRDRKKQQALTGNKPIHQEPISELEKRVVELVGKAYIEGSETVDENVPVEEELQLRMEAEDGVDESETSIQRECRSRSVTPNSNILKMTPRKCLKKKREEEMESKYLEIANKQAEALKMLAQCSVETVRINEMMATALKSIGDGLSSMADALKKVAASLDIK